MTETVLEGSSRFCVCQGDALAVLRAMPHQSVRCCVTSPPYYALRDYGVEGQIGLEKTTEEYVARLVQVFAEVRRVLTLDGTLWLNLGDSYSLAGKSGGHSGNKNQHSSNGLMPRTPRGSDGLKPKDLIGIPWLVTFALRADGWHLRSEIIWHKKAPMPESCTDRPTRAHEQVFLLSRAPTYYFDQDAVREPAAASTLARARYSRIAPPGSKSHVPGAATHTGLHHQYDVAHDHETPTNPLGRNIRSVWTLGPEPFAGAHFATMPTSLVEPCILAGCPLDGVVLDPFAGAATVGLVALRLGRRFIGIELNPEYAAMGRKRIADDSPLFNAEGVMQT